MKAESNGVDPLERTREALREAEEADHETRLRHLIAVHEDLERDLERSEESSREEPGA
jgi:hypothetical protein